MMIQFLTMNLSVNRSDTNKPFEERTYMSDLTQPQIYDQYVQKEPGEQDLYPKKPKNLDDMIQLYMEMLISHRVMEARLQKMESRLNAVSSLHLMNQGVKID